MGEYYYFYYIELSNSIKHRKNRRLIFEGISLTMDLEGVFSYERIDYKNKIHRPFQDRWIQKFIFVYLIDQLLEWHLLHLLR